MLSKIEQNVGLQKKIKDIVNKSLVQSSMPSLCSRVLCLQGKQVFD